jgi:hypothetical protein
MTQIPESNFVFKKPVYYAPKEGVDVSQGKSITRDDVSVGDRPLLEHEVPLTDDQIKSVNWTKLMASLVFTKCLQYAAAGGLATGTITGAAAYLRTSITQIST